MKKILYALAILINAFNLSQAEIISEIMYDPAGSDTGNEWIEIYNDSNVGVDLTTYKLFESNVNHSISTTNLYTNTGGNILNPGEYAVIVDNPSTFLNNHTGFSGKLFDSSFSLINSGEELILKNSALSNVFNITYAPQSSANNTGGTINFINNTWLVYKETPSSSSTLEIININTDTNNNNSTSTSSSSTTTSTTTNTNTAVNNVGSYLSYTSSGSNRYTLGDLKLLTPREINTVVGAETEFFVKSIDNKNNPVITSVYWSFGDGAEGIGTSTKHRYQNPGVYNAFIESEVSNAYGVDRISVKVENPNIKISDVSSNYVELENQSDTELNIGRFIIVSDQGMYTLSRMFIISPNSKVKIDGRVLGFSNLTNVKLMTAYNTFVTKYENKVLIDNSSTTIKEKEVEKNIKNKNIFPIKNVSSGLAPKRNPKLSTQNILKVKGTSTKVDTQSTNTVKLPENKKPVEIPPTNFVKKWLYWIYE